MKAKSFVFWGNKETYHVCFVCVEFKFQKKKYASFIFNLKVEKICSELSKQQTRDLWFF